MAGRASWSRHSHCSSSTTWRGYGLPLLTEASSLSDGSKSGWRASRNQIKNYDPWHSRRWHGGWGNAGMSSWWATWTVCRRHPRATRQPPGTTRSKANICGLQSRCEKVLRPRLPAGSYRDPSVVGSSNLAGDTLGGLLHGARKMGGSCWLVCSQTGGGRGFIAARMSFLPASVELYDGDLEKVRPVSGAPHWRGDLLG